MRIIVSGGGTGGHIYPALAIAGGIKAKIPDADILYVGTKNGMESSIVPDAGFEFKAIDISGIDRSSMLKASKSATGIPRSIYQAWKIVKRFAPDIVVGTGGYVSFPVVFAGTLFPSCRTLIHEQNAYPGITNRHLAKRVDSVLVTFEEAAQYLNARKIINTGLPVRREILDIKPDEACSKLGLKKERFTLLVFGGSRGAESINQAMLEIVGEYVNEDIQIIWVTGKNNYQRYKSEVPVSLFKGKTRSKLILLPYMDNMEDAMGAAHLAVCRAGASTLSELAILGLPAILVPYPYAAENHQEKNARALLQKNAVEMIIDEFLDGQTLKKKIQELRNNPGKLKDMSAKIKNEGKPGAINDILNTILN